jgi:hypothetical protein
MMGCTKLNNKIKFDRIEALTLMNEFVVGNTPRDLKGVLIACPRRWGKTTNLLQVIVKAAQQDEPRHIAVFGTPSATQFIKSKLAPLLAVKEMANISILSYSSEPSSVEKVLLNAQLVFLDEASHAPLWLWDHLQMPLKSQYIIAVSSLTDKDNTVSKIAQGSYPRIPMISMVQSLDVKKVTIVQIPASNL